MVNFTGIIMIIEKSHSALADYAINNVQNNYA